jgi:S-(hydroxymethyl)glutathione dehydrogenase / alcohol dehydrogenase
MRVRAAVAFEAAKPLTVTDVELEGPKAGEVMVEIKATGICHTDEFTLSGKDPEGLFPTILGHEGAGVVVDVGGGVLSVKTGDHVIPLYTPECRECEYCLSRKTNLCQKIRATQGAGVMPDGTSRFSLDGRKLHHYMGTSTFANFTVLPEIAVAKIREDAPFDKVCYIGCGVTTGIGAVINTAKVEPGANCVVFGLGGIGLNVIQGLRLAGAHIIVGVDLNPDKKEWGKRFGMTHFVNPKDAGNDLVKYLIDLTKGGADYAFECVGQRGPDARGARVLPQRLGRKRHHRGGARRRRDPHPPLPARHRPRLARLRLRGRPRPHRCAQDRRLVHGGQDRDRPHDHPPDAAHRHQPGVRPDARRQIDPQRRYVLIWRQR